MVRGRAVSLGWPRERMPRYGGPGSFIYPPCDKTSEARPPSPPPSTLLLVVCKVLSPPVRARLISVTGACRVAARLPVTRQRDCPLSVVFAPPPPPLPSPRASYARCTSGSKLSTKLLRHSLRRTTHSQSIMPDSQIFKVRTCSLSFIFSGDESS